MVDVANGMATTNINKTKFRNIRERSTLRNESTNAWWLTQVMPITKKLTTYATNDGQ